MLSIIVVSYNNSKEIENLIRNIKNELPVDTIENLEVIIVDNKSSVNDYLELKEKIREAMSSKLFDIRVFRLSKNYGYAGAVNIGVRLAKNNLVAISNPDILIEKDFFIKLYSLKKVSYKLLKNTIIAPTILLDNSKIVNSQGIIFHLAGYGILRGLLKNFTKIKSCRITTVAAPHGAFFIGDKKTLIKLGPFDPYYFSFLEDLDLGLRANMIGYRVLYIPHLIVRHLWGSTWGRELSSLKFYYTERNRLLTLLKNFPLKYIIRNLPYVIISELVSIAYSLLNSKLHIKIMVYSDLIKSREYIKTMRDNLKKDAVQWTDNTVLVLKKLSTYEFNHVIFEEKYQRIINKIYKTIYKAIG